MSSLRRPPQRGRPADCFFRSDVGSRGDELFFFNDTATTEIYTLSLHDALPISARPALLHPEGEPARPRARERRRARDRKSTRLNSSHITISYAVFCLKKKRRAAASSRIRWSGSRPRPNPEESSTTRCRPAAQQP